MKATQASPKTSWFHHLAAW